MHDLFKISYYKYHIEEWKDQKDQILSMVNFNNSTAKDNNIAFTDYFAQEFPMYGQPFLQMLTPYLNMFREIYQFRGIPHVWCQRYSKGDYFQPHDHGALGYSAVFYAEFNKDIHRATNFFAPFVDEMGMHKCIEPQVEEGDVIIFPASIMHMAPPNYSDENRTILSFNLE